MAQLWPEGHPIQVVLDRNGELLRFRWRDVWHEVSSIANSWRTQAGWWLPDAHAARAYIKVTTTDGLLCTLYRDLRDDAWYCARVYD